MVAEIGQLAKSLPKAELHLHIEGTLEPQMMFELARRNRVDLPYGSVDEVRRAYVFSDLQSFLDIYYAGCQVLVREQDFYDLTYAYLERAAAQGIRHAEIFFDPQSHTGRGIPFETVITGIHRALQDGDQTLHVSSGLILCFLRHLSEDAALQTLTEAMPFTEWLIGVGLDSSELGRPPSMFEHVYQRASELGLHAVAHAGEEGPPDYISEALDLLGAERIDHGVRCLEDERLVDRLVEEQVPLTVCPLSNVKLRVFPELRQHNLNRMLARGLRVTINSDDPAYFGGYLLENLHETATALRLTPDDLLTLARNSFRASFISDQERTRYLGEIDRVANQPSLNTIS